MKKQYVRRFEPAVYTKEVRDLCLNCRHERCINTWIGCEEYRRTVREVSNRSKRHKWGGRRENAGNA